MLIKLWNWDKNWTCTQVFEGHTHYVMQIVINPKDNNQFASASLDRTVKVNFLELDDKRLRRSDCLLLSSCVVPKGCTMLVVCVAMNCEINIGGSII